MRIRLTYLPLFIAVLLASCRPFSGDRELEEALHLAGENRPELEQVLEHYKDDSLKLEAARFLIRHMPGHYSYADTATLHRYAQAADSILTAMKGQGFHTICHAIDSIASRLGMDRLARIPDCRIVKAGFLIRNIDRAFDDWRQRKWNASLSFRDFCETLLPYKVEDLQPLDDWRTELRGRYGKMLEGMDLCDEYADLSYSAARFVDKALCEAHQPTIGLSLRHTCLPPSVRLRVPFGSCGDYAATAAMVMRSEGIPVYVEDIPLWVANYMGHSWDMLPGTDGRSFTFSGGLGEIGKRHFPEGRIGKIYRRTYAADPMLKALSRSGEWVPPLFRNIFQKDVTAQTLACSNVTIEVPGERDGYACLAFFDNRTWVPVALGKIRRGKAVFRDLGPHALSLPVRYDKDGQMKPIADPFILEYNGHTEKIVLDTSQRITMTLRRKYPVKGYLYEKLHRLKGGEFQASDDALFRRRHVFHRIRENRGWGYEVRVPDSVPPCRYWRYISYQRKSYCNMAELMFYAPGDSLPLKGRVIGTPGAHDDHPGYTREAVFDGALLTCNDPTEPDSAWVGLDMGRPVKMDRLFYYGRSDGNAVEVGDEYELFWWDGGRWQSLGRQRATRPCLEYRDAPARALVLLRDRTKGREERIFTYEDGRQQFW